MSRVFVSNIPENFTTNELQLLFQQANIPYSGGELKIMKSKRHTQDGQSTGRFVVLNFDSDVIANTAMEAINLMVVTVGPKDDKKEIHIRATPFIPNFRQYLENPKSNLVIYNIPAELNQSDLKELFAEFGKVLSTLVKKPTPQKGAPAPNAKTPTGLGYVLFEHEDEAVKAMEQANGKFLGPNQLFIQKYRTLKQRMEDNSEVLVKSLPRDWTEEQVKVFICEKAEMKAEELFAPNTAVTIRPDTRPETVNSNGVQAIFTCASKSVAGQVVEQVNKCGIQKFEQEGVTQDFSICAKLTRGMMAYKRAEESVANKKKYADSGRNIQVFSISKETTQDDIRTFFGRYGEIEEVSAPTRKAEEINEAIFHYNILFKTVEAADNAVEKAAKDEKSADKKIAIAGSEIRVNKFVEHHDVKSNQKHNRQRRDNVQE